ncbi:MAG: AAA family ATPase [Acidobacteriota bacterium]
MHITAVELENIKSHVDSRFEFPAGKISITGENGAGKTSIIEAIAWALFDNLEYKKEEFIRRGAKKAAVWATFESGLDGRRYTVFRDTETSYYVFDPILGARFANKTDRLADRRDEVARFMRQHFGVEPGTDLKALFRQAIGVPQGTFTAIFLEGAVERKAAFDKLLKVEEYRQGAEKLLDTARYIDSQIIDARVKIARIEAEMGRADTVESEFATITVQVRDLQADIVTLEKEISGTREQVAMLDLKERASLETRALADRLAGEKTRAKIVFRQKETDLRTSREADEKLESVRGSAGRHIEILGRLVELERERRERDELRGHFNKIESAIASVTADRKNVLQSLEKASKAHREIEELKPKAAEQKTLEKDLAASRDLYAHSRSLEDRIAALNQTLERLRESYRQQQTRKGELEPTVATAGSLGELEKKDAETVQSIAKLRADLERDQKFQSEISNGLCPILSEKCLNLKDGQTLDSFIKSQFTDLRSRINLLEKDKLKLDTNLKAAREAEKNVALLAQTSARIDELTAEGKKLRVEKDELEKRLEGAVGTEKKIEEIEARLKELDNPEARIKFLETEALRGNDLRHEMSAIEKNLERLESERRLLTERLDEFKDLDQQMERLVRDRGETLEAHRAFILYGNAAAELPDRLKAFNVAEKELSDLSTRSATAELDVRKAVKEYDAIDHQTVRASLLEGERKHAGTQAALVGATVREHQLASDIRHLAEIRETMKSELDEQERLKRVAEMTAFIRDTLKESAPRVARNYVFLVSVEANQMFGEITGNAGRTLKWNEDYGISLDDDGFERPFISLSGGEQMAAALSIRLAILKQLSDIRVAFFDEPTTNLDTERRENLALQLSQIKNFDQLFVISHDDTFENYVDTVISLN